MRRGRILVLMGLIIFIGALAVGVILWKRSQETPPVVEVGEGTPQPGAPVPMTEIVVAAQNIPRGMQIAEDANAVIMQGWPADMMPEGAIDNLEAVYDRITRVDIVLGMPILEDMLTETPGDVGGVGSEAALQIPEGQVAYALPVARYSSMAWALQPGDHVDVIISLLVVELDEEFQSAMPNQAQCLSPSEDPACIGMDGTIGRMDVLVNGWTVNTTPSEGQRPRLVTQLTVQDLLVLHVGDWPDPAERFAAEETPEPEEQVAEGETPPSPPPDDRVEPLTLAITPQDAIVLDYAQAVGARINFVLRSAGDTQNVSTNSVTLQYLMNQFNIELPPKLPYGFTPPISSLERIPRTESAAQYGAPAQYGGAAEQ